MVDLLQLVGKIVAFVLQIAFLSATNGVKIGSKTGENGQTKRCVFN